MLDWLAQFLMDVSGGVTGWLITPDSANFGIAQLTISLLLIVLCILLVIYWPSLVAHYKNASGPRGPNRTD